MVTFEYSLVLSMVLSSGHYYRTTSLPGTCHTSCVIVWVPQSYIIRPCHTHITFISIMQAMLRLEKNRGRKYKYVAFTRPDLQFPTASALGPWSRQPQKLLRIENDWAMFMPRRFVYPSQYTLYSTPFTVHPSCLVGLRSRPCWGHIVCT
jgi:hypothetical protein